VEVINTKQQSSSKHLKLAIIDIGSNSIRMLIYDDLVQQEFRHLMKKQYVN